MRWTESGKIKKKDKAILYSGPEELHQKEVGIILNKEAGKASIGQKPVNDLITTVRFQSRHTKTTVAVIYAPTEEAEEEEKDNFYDQCQDVLNEIPKHDMVLLLGDMNAQVDSNRQGLEHIIGPHGSAQQTNDNGEQLLMFCNSNGICIGNTYFKHKLTHKKKWWSPDGTVENEIDYIYINQRLRSALSDVRAYRRADIGSDHQLVIATLKLKFKKILKPKVDKPHNIEMFKNQKVRREFQLALQYRFGILQHCTDVEEQWNIVKDAITTAAEEKIVRGRG